MPLAVDRTNALDEIRARVEACVGKRVKVRANRGRRKVLETEGIIESTYPKLFVIKLDGSEPVRRLSYTYADLLTSTVELTLDEDPAGVVNL
ncbi:MAG: protein veg [Firmicutes bacterium]|nr:protein veg [Bacillota bacterium]MBO2519044.1 protein veg [Bacillota bacterium]NMA71331.1 protein veg [Bacillota bacterium]